MGHFWIRKDDLNSAAFSFYYWECRDCGEVVSKPHGVPPPEQAGGWIPDENKKIWRMGCQMTCEEIVLSKVHSS